MRDVEAPERLETRTHPLADRPAIARQGWRDLTFLHWPVSPESLRPLVPEPLELELHDERAWVSVVAFRVASDRLRGVPAFLGIDHGQVNVRTYVQLDGEPGIFFLRAFSSSWLSAVASWAATGISHQVAAIEHVREGDALRDETEAAGGRVFFRGEIGEHRGLPLQGTLDHFLLERAIAYAPRLGSLWSIPVEHNRFVPRTVHLSRFQGDLLDSLDIPELLEEPALAHYTKGLDAAVLLPSVRLALPV